MIDNIKQVLHILLHFVGFFNRLPGKLADGGQFLLSLLDLLINCITLLRSRKDRIGKILMLVGNLTCNTGTLRCRL